MPVPVFAWTLGAWAFKVAAAAFHSADLELPSLLADVGGHTVEAGKALSERPRDVVRKAAERGAQQIEKQHRGWLDQEFAGRPAERAEAAGTIEALPFVLRSSLPDPVTIAREHLTHEQIADAVVRNAGTHDERFRRDTFGARLLRQLVTDVLGAAEHDEAFRAEMHEAITVVLEERSRQQGAALHRIERSLAAGAERLHLAARHQRRQAPRDLRDLLMTERRATGLVGREEELTPLRAWLGPCEGRDISVHCVTGKAGAGKTRLAIELCEWAERAGWSAGFVRQDELDRFYKRYHPSEWRWQQPTLVVVDYASASVKLLREWFEALARGEAGEQDQPLRILLLERHAERESGWWQDVTSGGGYSGPGGASLIDADAPLPLGPLRAVEHRRALLADAMRLAATLLGRTPPALPPSDNDALFDAKLADDTIETEPLFLLMAGIVAVETGAPEALAMRRLDMARYVMANERRRLEHLADGAGADRTLLWHLAACITLQNGCDAEAVTTLVDEERRELGDRSLLRTDQLVALLHDALAPPEGNGVDAVRPDLIGEAFLLGEIAANGRSVTQQMTIVERAFARAKLRVVATVIRTAQDYAEGHAAHVSVDWLARLARHIDDPFELMAIANELPDQTLALRERAVEIQGRVAERFAELSEGDADLLPLRATSLHTLATRLGAVGDRDAALTAAREAADLYRALAAQRPDAFLPDLAMSLNNLANRLSEVGDRDAALTAAREAVDIRRALAAQWPDAFRPDLAMSLNNLANMLSEAGDRDAALTAAREAADLYRALVAQRPDAFRPYLAGSLNTLANRLREVGDRDAALTAAREAADLYRALAAQRPDAFLPDLARSLNTLAAMLSEVGDHDAALTEAREAADLYRALVAQRPDAFLPDLATSLNTLAAMLSEVGDHDAALTEAREAVDMYRALAAQRPDAFLPDLATSLNTLAAMLSEVGDHDAALTEAREAADLYRALVAQRPDVFRPYLAGSLNNLANRLREVGDRDAALTAAREAADLYRALAAQRPDAFRHDLARSLMVRAACLDAAAQPEQAITDNIEAITLLTPAFVRTPRAFARLMEAMARDYLRRCEHGGSEPDQALLAPVVAAFAGLQGLRPEGL